MEFSENIIEAIRQSGFSSYRIAKDIGISESLFSKWKKNPTSEISSLKIVKIADYLGCSVDYLLGRTPEAGFQTSQFSQDETELISLYRQLNQEGQEKILDSADDLVASGKYKKSGADFLGAQAV